MVRPRGAKDKKKRRLRKTPVDIKVLKAVYEVEGNGVRTARYFDRSRPHINSLLKDIKIEFKS